MKRLSVTGFKALGGGRNTLLARFLDDLRLFPRPLRERVRVRGKNAFTLAEVLITLGIIGVVAAMTIPTLVANYQEKSWNTSASVFERKLEEALKTMNTQSVLAGYTTTQSFVDELAKHFKIVKTCDSNNLKNCIEENITWNIIDISNGGSESETLNLANLKTAADLGKADWDTETIGVQFANGTTAIMAYDPECRQDPYSNQVTGMSCISMIYDTSGGKSPNTTSKDVRAFNNKIANAAFKMGSKVFGQPFKPEPISKAECERLKGNLDINSCNVTNDYWAGAVKVCGGKSKMATEDQLIELANYVYNTTGLTNIIAENLTLDTTKATSLGFKLDYSNKFYVWFNKDSAVAGYSAYYRYFMPTYTSGTFSNGNVSDRQAVCVE